MRWVQCHPTGTERKIKNVQMIGLSISTPLRFYTHLRGRDKKISQHDSISQHCHERPKSRRLAVNCSLDQLPVQEWNISGKSHSHDDLCQLWTGTFRFPL